MTYDDGLLLTESGNNWSTTSLTYTFYSTVNPFPDYYFTNNPTNTTWQSAYTSVVTTGDEDFIQLSQKDLIRHLLSDTSGVDYRVSFSDVTPLTFSESNSPSAVGDIFIANANLTNSGELGSTVYPNAGNDFAGDIIFDNDSGSHTTIMQSELGVGEEGAMVTLHELSHAMGLLHADLCLTSELSNQKFTIMTDSAEASPSPDMDSSVFPTGLQILDIVALQSLYGVNWGGARGHSGADENTVYSKETAFATDNAHDAFMYTIWDGGGNDVIDASDYTTPAEIDLRQGHFSSIGVQGDSGNTPVAFDTPAAGMTPEYDAGNVAIAYHAIIENAIGTNGNDTLIGNEWNNILYGGSGNDTIYGDGVSYDGDAGYHDANTIVDGTSTVYSWGPDAIAPAADDSGDDILIGGAGNDLFFGGKGNDIIHGGYVKSEIDTAFGGSPGDWDPAGQFVGTNNAAGAALSDINYSSDDRADGCDIANYSRLPVGTGSLGIDVTFDNTTYTSPTIVVKGSGGEYGTDTLFSIEGIVGTPWNDVFEGTTVDDFVYGSKGNDQYTYFATAPTIGGSTVDYSSLDVYSADIVATSTGSGFTVDKYYGTGPSDEDTLSGNVHAIVGTRLNDTFNGFLPGTSVYFNGGAGSDSYNFNMNDLDAGPTTASVQIDEDASGSFSSDVHVSNYDSVSLSSYAMFGNIADITFQYYKWNSSISGNDVLTLSFSKPLATGTESVTYGSSNYIFGSASSDSISIPSSGIHIVDGGPGTNTIDYSAATGGVTADLSTGIVSNNGWGYADTLTNISAISGSHHNDTLTGDSTTTTVSYANASGGVIVDLHNGTATGDGSDTLTDIPNVIGSAYDDYITSDANDNVIDGGAGNDWVIYGSAASAVTVDLTNGTATGDGSDTLTSIENVIGSAYDDSLTGSSTNHLSGFAGNDTLQGGIADYSFDPAGVTVDLSMGTATDGWSNTDTLIDIHAVIGSIYADTLTAGTDTDLLSGGQGNDTLIGGTADYSHDVAGVTVDLSMGTATDGWSNTDTLTDVHIVIGSAYADTIAGDGNDNGIVGGAGNDTLDGGGGFNTVDYSQDPGSVTVDLSMGTATDGWSNTDTLSNFQAIAGSHFDDALTGDGTTTVSYAHALQGVTVDLAAGTATGDGNDTLSGIVNVIGSAYDDTIYGGTSGQNIVAGGAGNDYVDGGYGAAVIVDYSHDPSGVTVDLSIGTATDGWSTTDTLVNIAGIIGSHHDDNITGTWIEFLSYQNSASGVTVDMAGGTVTGDGNDTFSALGGIIGSSHDDLFLGNMDGSALDGGTGINTISYENYTSSVAVDLSGGYAYSDYGGDGLSNFPNATGTAYDDTITGDSSANVLYGAGSNDYLTGNGGADTFLFKAATAFTGESTISDFTTGDGDKIDLTDVLTGYDPVHDAIGDFVSLSASGGNTTVSVDQDGTGGTYSPTAIAVLLGVTGLDVNDMISNGNLVVPT